MGKRKVTILETAAIAVAEVAFFIEGKGLPTTAKKFTDDVFDYFEKLSYDVAEYRLCTNKKWKGLGYRCANYKQKFVVAFLSLENEIVICDFIAAKALK